MAQPWPGKADAVAGNFYQLPDGKVRFYAGGDEFRVYGVDNQGNEKIALDGLMSQLGQSLSGLLPKGPRSYAGAQPMWHDFGGLPSKADRGPTPNRVPPDPNYKQQELDAGEAAEDWRPGAGFPGQQVTVIRNNEPDAQASEMERMRQQYGAGASFWDTEEGKDLLLDTMSNEYTGDQTGLPGFYQDQTKAGLGQMDKIIESMGYTGDMATWAKNNPALALREYNKRQPNAYSGTGPSDAEIEQAMKDGNFSPSEGSPNPLGKTGEARESNTAQTAEAQNVARQAINTDSLNQIEAYRDTAIPGMGGKQMLSQNMMNLLRRQGRL